MDQGRYNDLLRLERLMNNPDKPRYVRRGADKARKNIINQLKDRKLQAMRDRLIKASQAHDEYQEWKIANQMRAYTKQAQMEEYS